MDVFVIADRRPREEAEGRTSGTKMMTRCESLTHESAGVPSGAHDLQTSRQQAPYLELEIDGRS